MPAIAHEAKLDLDLKKIDELSHATPTLTKIKPSGEFTSTNTLFNCGVMLALTGLALFMDLAGVPMSPMILAYILSRKIEEYLRKGMTYSTEGWIMFIKRPVSLVFLLVAVGSLVIPAVKNKMKKQSKKSTFESAVED